MALLQVMENDNIINWKENANTKASSLSGDIWSWRDRDRCLLAAILSGITLILPWQPTFVYVAFGITLEPLNLPLYTIDILQSKHKTNNSITSRGSFTTSLLTRFNNYNVYFIS